MLLFQILVLGLAFITMGVILDRAWIWWRDRKDERFSAENPLPLAIPELDAGKTALIDLYLKQWQVVIETQMHFNDLIIRFRALTLTAFAALTGAAVTVGQLTTLSGSALYVVLALPLAFWVAAAVLDLLYYHRLLIGAVIEAAKFDDHAEMKNLGMFGMTATIEQSVRPRTARVLVVLYYAVPLLVVALLLVAAAKAGSFIAPTGQ